jgi:hypothetical protein
MINPAIGKGPHDFSRQPLLRHRDITGLKTVMGSPQTNVGLHRLHAGQVVLKRKL